MIKIHIQIVFRRSPYSSSISGTYCKKCKTFNGVSLNDVNYANDLGNFTGDTNNDLIFYNPIGVLLVISIFMSSVRHCGNKVK